MVSEDGVGAGATSVGVEGADAGSAVDFMWGCFAENGEPTSLAGLYAKTGSVSLRFPPRGPLARRGAPTGPQLVPSS